MDKIDFSQLQIPLSKQYELKSLIAAIVAAAIVFTCIAVAVFRGKEVKKGWFVVAFLEAIGLVGAHFNVVCYHKLPPLFTTTTVYGYSQEEVNQKVEELLDEMAEELIDKGWPLVIIGFVALVVFILGIIFMAKNKAVPKPAKTASLVLYILRYLFVTPLPFVLVLFGKAGTEDAHFFYFIGYLVLCLIPYIILAAATPGNGQPKAIVAAPPEAPATQPAATTDVNPDDFFGDSSSGAGESL